jgi:pimeloyl-ACP methyl ester carboxylesterase
MYDDAMVDMAVKMRAVTFDGHLGYLHGPPAANHNVGIVICPALGRDGRCSYRPMHDLAEGLAAAGFATLRFELLGCGDSLDLPQTPDGAETTEALSVWMTGVQQAVRYLRDTTGVSKVVLAGVRFGATLAILNARLADGLVLLAPILRGKAWLRELKLSTAVLAPTTVNLLTEDGLDTDGLFLPAATAASLEALDLTALAAPACPTFLAAQNPQIEAYGQEAIAAGRPLCLNAFPGFAAMFEDTSRNQTPALLFGQVTDWLTATFPATGTAQPKPLPATEDARLDLRNAFEVPVTFGAGLRGVLCTPQTPSDRHKGRVVMFCNTSAEPRAGIGGFSTLTARALAQAGIAALRFDFAGIGDSQSPGTAAALHVYETDRHPDMQQAIAFVQAQGFDKVVLIGVCSGGYHALNLGPALPATEAIVSINTLRFVWEGDPPEPDLGRSSHTYWQLAMDPATWGRLLKNNIDVATIAKTIARRLKARYLPKNAGQTLAGFRASILGFVAGGGRTLMITGTEDASLDTLEAAFGPKGAMLVKQPGGHVLIDPQIDHGLALRNSRQRVTSYLLDFVSKL